MITPWITWPVFLHISAGNHAIKWNLVCRCRLWFQGRLLNKILKFCVRTWFCFILKNFALIGQLFVEIIYSLRYTDIGRRRFSIWRPSAILNLKNFGILSSRPWKHNLYLHTKFRWNPMISGWDIAIKLFSKWRPSAILNFWNSVFWSYGLW